MSYPDKTIQRALELYNGCSAEVARKLLQAEMLQIKTPNGESIYTNADIPDERTIRRWRKEKLSKEHFDKMAEMAKLLIRGFGEVQKRTPKGDEFDIHEYTIIKDDSGYGLTRELLGSHLAAHIETLCEQDKYTTSDWECFWSHLRVYYPDIEAKWLYSSIREKPYEWIETLKTLAQGEKFKGTCPVCKDLY